MTPAAPQLAAVVIGYRAPAFILDAVRSLVEQDMPLEIVVVNSGGGGAARLLREAGFEVPVIEFEERLFVGAARNRGIAATCAPFVAFLADDCTACPGWARYRLEHHLAGRPAVASALVNANPDSLVAWATHLTTYMRRLPGLPETEALRYGVSLERGLFDRYGLFSEVTAIGEDTDFLSRLPPDLRPVWDPRIRTAHRNSTRLADMLAEQGRRGLRYGARLRRTTGLGPGRILRQIWRDRRNVGRFIETGLDGAERDTARKALPLVRLALLVKAVGGFWGALWTSPEKAVRQ